MAGWDNFFLGHVGASAALGGLPFVAISLNLPKISSAATLADRALLALSLLLAILIAASFMLIPRQSGWVVGIEVLLVAVGLAAVAVTRQYRSSSDNSKKSDSAKSAVNVGFLIVAVAPYFVGGALLLAGWIDAGAYFVAAAIILSFVKAVLDAWVLLIESNR